MAELLVGPLVRATSATSAVIWAECSEHCEVTLRATPDLPAEGEIVIASMHVVCVGGRYYAAPQLMGLQPATWYNYRLSTSADDTEIGSPETAGGHKQLVQCFRTLDPPVAHTALTLAYGSCRRLEMPQDDALSAFGGWLMNQRTERETNWPRILLLIGDQIYADDPPEVLAQKYPQLSKGAQSFADFASLYEHAWGNDAGVRQVLAALPTFTIFDDHEITNNWNTVPTWRAQALQRGLEQVLVDGLVAYWVYQGWGNLRERSAARHPCLQIMQEAEQSGEDALEALRACIKRQVYGEVRFDWHYDIPTVPPIFVADLRADRPAILQNATGNPQTDEEPARIMSQQQMGELAEWMHEHDTMLAMLVSSVPVLLPPFIGFVEYVMGMRLWQQSNALLLWLGRQLRRLQQRIILLGSFDHWPVCSASWKELSELLSNRQHDMLVLSGDVHFSYAMEARNVVQKPAGASLYQFVCTPLENRLGRISKRLILWQARWKRLSYGGLETRMLPLEAIKNKKVVRHDLLLQRVVALVRLVPRDDERSAYEIGQEYLGVKDGGMEVVGRTMVQRRDKER